MWLSKAKSHVVSSRFPKRTHILIICDAIQQKVHKVRKQNFTREAFKEKEVKMIKIMFLQKTVGRDV